ARVAFGGMAGTPARARVTEAALSQVDLDQSQTWDAAVTAIASDFTPLSDHRASATYRLTVAQNLVRKVLMELAAGVTSDTRIAYGDAHV
ncbi:MAG: xanthine dehydrogenase small subunit, partial [Hyphomicrobiaceae bacterium]|nr:xanthine dehydrogenase small subunit [Hyphomicrobiaceae bacterium]